MIDVKAFVSFLRNSGLYKGATKNIFAVTVTVCLFLSGAFYAENVITEDWWRNAKVADVVKRFDHYLNFLHYDQNGRSLLMYALKYSRDPNIPMYFMLNKSNSIKVYDVDDLTAIDYARQNPIMEEPLEFLLERRNEEFSGIGVERDEIKFYSPLL